MKQDCGFVCLDLREREREIKRVKKISDLCGFWQGYEEREREIKKVKKMRN